MQINSVTKQTLILWSVIGLALLGSFNLGSWIGESTDPAFAIMTNLLTGALALWAFANPRNGLYIVLFQAMFSDEYKRIVVIQGNASRDLVITVLIAPLISICVIHLSIFLRSVVFRTMKVEPWYWYFEGVIGLITVGMLVFGEGDFASMSQFAANVGLYLSLLPLIALLLPTMKEWRKYLGTQVLCVFPSALWGIKQYYMGFTKLEWDYAMTGLSPVHYISMVTGGDHARIFGFLGSAAAFGCISMYGTYALWQSFAGREHRFLYLVAGVVMMIAVVLSTQRSMMLIPFIILISYFLMLSPIRTGAFYIMLVVLLIIGVLSSQWMLDVGLDRINEFIRFDSDWGARVLRVDTFSDRLRGWTNFLEPSTWSLFGTGASSAEEYNEKGGHDLVNKMLIKVGVAGLLPMLLLIIAVLFLLHRIVWRAPSVHLKKEGAFLLACFVPLLVMNIMGGGNLNTTPSNLQMWSMLAGILVFRKQYGIRPWESNQLFLKTLRRKVERSRHSTEVPRHMVNHDIPQ